MIDYLCVLNRALSIRTAGGDKHRHTRSNIGTGERAATQPSRADDDHAMWIAGNDVSTHTHEVIDKVHAALKHLFKKERGACGLCG